MSEKWIDFGMIAYRKGAKSHVMVGKTELGLFKTLCGRTSKYHEIWETLDVDCKLCLNIVDNMSVSKSMKKSSELKKKANEWIKKYVGKVKGSEK